MTAVRVRGCYLALLVVVVVLAVFHSAIHAEILSVDDDQLFTYLINLDGWSLKGLFTGGGSGYYYRPLLGLSFIVDRLLWGPHESFMHLENVLLHAANSLLVYCITRDLAPRYRLDSPALPVAAGLLFGLHPLACEPVNWISGRSDLLAALFLFSAMLLVLKAVARGSIAIFAAASCSFLLATLAKETAVFWFPAALFFVYCAAREDRQRSPRPCGPPALRAFAPYLLLSLAPACYFLLRHLAFSREDGGIGLAVKGVTGANYDLLNKLRVTVKVFGFYLKKTVLPLPLNFATISVSNWYVPVGVAGLLFCCWLLYRRSTVSALLLMAACIISPALLVPLGRMAWTPVAERYLYMPDAFVVIALVLCGARWCRRSALPARGVTLAVALAVAGSGYLTYRRNLVWQHNLTIFQDCVAKTPEFAPAKNELARALQNAGRYEEARKIFLGNVVPETDKFRIISEINRSNSMAEGNNIEGGIANLMRLHYTASQPAYDEYLRALLRLYERQQIKETDSHRKRELYRKQIELVKEIQGRSGDPYLLYRIGQLYLTVKDRANAARYFQSAADKAPANAFYRGPAQRLAASLAREK